MNRFRKLWEFENDWVPRVGGEEPRSASALFPCKESSRVKEMYRSLRCDQKEPKIFLVGPVVGLIVKIVAEVIKKAVYEKILSKDGVPLINNRFSCLLLSTWYLEIVGYLNQLRNLEFLTLRTGS